jgi:putative spermidine/putrescine transport system ATP-binding protein
MAIRFDNVTFRYPDRRAGVFDIDFTVEDGEFLAVIGPSGSGKTTVLKLLAGFVKPEQGRILVDGVDVAGLPPHRRDLGVVFQSYALFPHMPAWQNVAYPLKVRGLDQEARRRRAMEALARVGLEGIADKSPGEMSGGQQQRVALARALVFEPRALLLDEPLSALDASLRADLRDEILRVQREAGITTLHVTHDQEEALSIADRVAVMTNGRILQIDDPVTLYDRPTDSTVASFVGHANLWAGTVADARTVTTPIGRLICDAAGWNQGDATSVLVRPEHVRPTKGDDAAANGVNEFGGAVVHDRFLGSLRRFDLAVGGGVIRAETNYRGPVSRVSIPPEAIRLLTPTPPNP